MRRENAALRDETRQLKQKLRVPPDAREDRVTRLRKQLMGAETRRLETEREFLDVRRSADSTHRVLGVCKKMAQDRPRELRRRSSYYEKETRGHRERAEEASERRVQDLRRENDRSRQMPAKVKCRPSLPQVALLLLLPAAHRGPEAPGGPLGHRAPRKEEGQAVRAQEPRATCGFDPVSKAAGS